MRVVTVPHPVGGVSHEQLLLEKVPHRALDGILQFVEEESMITAVA
jgi:hypothetical protein